MEKSNRNKIRVARRATKELNYLEINYLKCLKEEKKINEEMKIICEDLKFYQEENKNLEEVRFI